MTPLLAPDIVNACERIAQNTATFTLSMALYELAKLCDNRAVTGTELLAVAQRLLAQVEKTP